MYCKLITTNNVKNLLRQIKNKIKLTKNLILLLAAFFQVRLKRQTMARIGPLNFANN